MEAFNIDRNRLTIDLQEILGRGGEGTVYKAASSYFDEPLAAKHQTFRPDQLPSIFNSLAASLLLSSRRTAVKCNERILCLQGIVIKPSIVPAKYVEKLPGFKKLIFTNDSLPDNECFLLYEYVPGVSLDKKLKTPIDEKKYIKQALEGVALMHSRSIVHLDIKPENIMVTADDNLKIVDLGFICTGKSCARRGGTTSYAGPEVFNAANKKAYLFESDIFALGLTIYEIVTKKVGMPGVMGVHFAAESNELELDFPKNTEKYKPLIQSMVLRDPAMRPTAAQALEIFNKINVGGFRRY